MGFPQPETIWKSKVLLFCDCFSYFHCPIPIYLILIIYFDSNYNQDMIITLPVKIF